MPKLESEYLAKIKEIKEAKPHQCHSHRKDFVNFFRHENQNFP
jgi:hypothetical protein